jgi:hypothetical protein
MAGEVELPQSLPDTPGQRRLYARRKSTFDHTLRPKAKGRRKQFFIEKNNQKTFIRF